MLIPEYFVQELLDRVDVVDVVSQYVQLKKGGVNLLGLCPFHQENTPSFTVSPSKQFYHCFGCGAHGNAINFIMKHRGLTFPEAVKSLAGGVGMQVPEKQYSPERQAAYKKKKSRQEELLQILSQAQWLYSKNLRHSSAAIDYLKSRRLTGQIAKKFSLGWTGESFQNLREVFENYEASLLVDSGLVIENEKGKRYDRFRSRITFPIYNQKGQLVGFGGRVLNNTQPKYLNSPETEVFHKSQELYGLWENRQGIRKASQVLVVEGYMDVVSLAQQGIDYAVATLGTATTEEHLLKLMRLSDRIIFSFDGDEAGKKAAWRALEIALPLLRDDINFRFLFLEKDYDPDSFIKAFGKERFENETKNSLPLSGYFLKYFKENFQLDEVEGRAACIDTAVDFFNKIPDISFKTQLKYEFSKLVKLTASEFDEILFKKKKQESNKKISINQTTSKTDFDNPFQTNTTSYKNNNRKAHKSNISGSSTTVVMPLAKRILYLLVTHPEIFDNISDYHLEVLQNHPHLELVVEFIAFVMQSEARHIGAWQEQAQNDPEMSDLLHDLAINSMHHEILPEPKKEWLDAIIRIELDNLQREQQELIKNGLINDDQRNRYQAINAKIRALKLKNIN